MKRILPLLLCCACSVNSVNFQNNSGLDVDVKKSAQNYFDNGKYDKAIGIYKELLSADEKNTHYRFLYAESLRLSHKSDEALGQYEVILQNNPDNLDAIEGQGLTLLQKGDILKAAEKFNFIVKEDATRWRTVNALGVVLAMSDKKQEAFEYFNAALDISSNNAAVLNNMALAAAYGGNYDEALSYMRKALSVVKSKNKKQMENNLALVYGMSGQMDKAEELLMRHMSKASVYNNLGFYAKINNDKELAKAYFSKALSASPVFYDKAWENLQSVGG